MEFRILGPLEVADGERVIDLGGPRERALLARLLISANLVVSADRLAEDLWSGDPPAHWLPTLRVYVSRLRRALALWRGPALSGVADLPFARADAARLEEARLSAVEDWVEAELGRGNHVGMTAELDGLVTSCPLRERLRGQRMRTACSRAAGVRGRASRPAAGRGPRCWPAARRDHVVHRP